MQNFESIKPGQKFHDSRSGGNNLTVASVFNDESSMPYMIVSYDDGKVSDITLNELQFLSSADEQPKA